MSTHLDLHSLQKFILVVNRAERVDALIVHGERKFLSIHFFIFAPKHLHLNCNE